jgi:Ca2+-binding EF-hand superfamily protein
LNFRVITWKEQQALFEKNGADPEKRRVRAYMEAQFRDLDKDGDGKVHLDEFLAGSNMLDMVEEERRRENAERRRHFKQMKQFFMDADSDGDGAVTKEEQEELFSRGGSEIHDERVVAYMRHQFDELDADGDGRVEIAEFLAAANLEDMLEEDRKKELKARKKQFQKMRKTFMDADTDGDGERGFYMPLLPCRAWCYSTSFFLTFFLPFPHSSLDFFSSVPPFFTLFKGTLPRRSTSCFSPKLVMILTTMRSALTWRPSGMILTRMATVKSPCMSFLLLRIWSRWWLRRRSRRWRSRRRSSRR